MEYINVFVIIFHRKNLIDAVKTDRNQIWEGSSRRETDHITTKKFPEISDLCEETVSSFDSGWWRRADIEYSHMSFAPNLHRIHLGRLTPSGDLSSN